MQLLSFPWNPSEVLFNLGPIQIRYYSLMFIIAFSLGYFIMKRIYEKENIPLEYLDSLFMYTVIATLLGARLGEVFFYNWGYYQNHLVEILLPIKADPNATLFGFIDGYKFTGFAGLASHGAAIGIITAMYLYRRKYKYKTLLWILDKIVIPVAIGGVYLETFSILKLLESSQTQILELYSKEEAIHFHVIQHNYTKHFATYLYLQFYGMYTGKQIKKKNTDIFLDYF